MSKKTEEKIMTLKEVIETLTEMTEWQESVPTITEKERVAVLRAICYLNNPIGAVEEAQKYAEYEKVLPCAVGEEYYVIFKGCVIKAMVDEITFSIRSDLPRVHMYFDIKSMVESGLQGYLGYTEHNFKIGKTAFWTREHALHELERQRIERGEKV